MTDFREFFTRHAEGYSRSDSHASGDDLKMLLNLLSFRKYGKAADIATGTGFTAMGIASLCESVVAVDFTAAMLEEAKKNASASPESARISFLQATAEDTGLESAAFDLVTCRRAAHHFTDKKAFLEEVKRMLRKGGIFALVDMLSPDEDHGGLLDHLERLRDSSHIHASSESEWKELISGAGFEILESRVETEERSFGKWLYPVASDTEEGKSCIEFIRQNTDELSRAGVWNASEDLFIKKRGIIIAIS